jgi:N-methylhydantoinase A
MPLVDIHTIGAGGGSLAWLEAGALRVGPQSAGADPGPASYGRGGTAPTVTDANLFLKRLDPAYFLGGRMGLDEKAAARAIHGMAAQVGLDDVAFAEGMLAIINARMADAMRTITVKQGIDPRNFSLVAFGGAGPMHAVWLAKELEISEVIVPWSPGTFSAWGMLQTDIRHDVSQTFYRRLDGLPMADVDHVFKLLEGQGREILHGEGVPDAQIHFLRTADMRYVGQEYTVNVAADAATALGGISQSFHDAHRTRYGHATPDAPVEFVNLRVASIGRLDREAAGFTASEKGEDPVMGVRDAIFDGKALPTTILLRRRLGPGATYAGPLVVEEDTATTVVPPGYRIVVDALGNMLITPEVAGR